MSAKKLYPVPESYKQDTQLTPEQYNTMYEQSVNNPDAFWAEQMTQIDWYKKPTIIKNTTFDAANLSIKWFEDGELNVSYNCIDRHLATRAKKTALFWEGDSPEDSQEVWSSPIYFPGYYMGDYKKQMDGITNKYNKMNKEDIIPYSDCCGAETTETEMGICPDCLEHCEFTYEDDEE